MLDNPLVLAALAGGGVALAAAVLGCFVVWRRMAYYGDATAHAALLGVALSLGFSVSIFGGVLVVSIMVALLVTLLTRRGQGMDTVLGVLAHAGLAFGLVAVSLLPEGSIDLHDYLTGNIMSVDAGDLWVIWGGVFLVLGLVAWRWQGLLTSTLDNDLALASGINPKREQLILTLALALVVAVAIKVVGVLLIASLLIIPAAAARPLTRSPETMVALSAVIGVGSALGGLRLSMAFDTPAGATIVCVAVVLFILSQIARLPASR
ncbi:MAG: metal ABC transporter permease [Rhodobacterales bacterium]|nr:metal ABC transporter permease [Rhodobacterales bacterium]